MTTLRRWIAQVLVTLYPTRCFACSEPLGLVQRLGACPSCWSDLRPLCAPLCRGCGWPLSSSADIDGAAGGRCASCSAGRPALDAVTAHAVYDGCARRFLLRGKFGRRREIMAALGAQLAERVAVERFAPDGSLVVPVPSHVVARLERGFSPAEEIARRVAARNGLAWRPALRRRWRSGRSLKRLGARGRREAALTAFVAARSGGLVGRTVVLVDDVLTTGATLAGCAAALRRAGAAEVRAAVWARTPGPSRGLLL